MLRKAGMVKEENLNRSLHKLLLVILKYTPIVNALGCLLNTVFGYFNIDLQVLSYICSMSLTTWLFIFVASIVFKFCFWYKMLLYYILVMDIISIIDYYIGIPLSDFNLLILYLTITGITLFILLYNHVKNTKKPITKDN